MNTATLTTSASNFLSAFDGAVDNFCTNGTKFDVLNLIQRSNLRGADLVAIQTKLQKTTDELELLVIDADEQITEGYSNLSKAQQRDLLVMYHTILEQVPTKNRKARAPKDGIIRVKPVEVVVTESFNTVFAVCPKYNAVRVFNGSVQVTGNKVVASEAYEIRMPKDYNFSAMQTMTCQEILDELAGNPRTEYTPVTLSGKTIEFVQKF